jgi:hypothetical protein
MVIIRMVICYTGSIRLRQCVDDMEVCTPPYHLGPIFRLVQLLYNNYALRKLHVFKILPTYYMKVIIPTFPACRCRLMCYNSVGPWILSFILRIDTISTGSRSQHLRQTSERHCYGILIYLLYVSARRLRLYETWGFNISLLYYRDVAIMR